MIKRLWNPPKKTLTVLLKNYKNLGSRRSLSIEDANVGIPAVSKEKNNPCSFDLLAHYKGTLT